MYFLGDSALKLLNDETLLAGPEKDQQVWCPESGVMDLNLLTNITFLSPVTGNNAPFGDIAFVNRPATMVLLPSTDNANMITESALKAALKDVVTAIQAESPETKIIFSSLTPVARSYQYEDITFLSPVTGNNAPFGDIAFVNRPATMVILPSTDNANLITEPALKAAIKDVVTAIQAESPETKIIFSSLTPVARNYQSDDITFEVINRVNKWIAEAAAENNVKYLDAAFELAGTDGFLPENFQNGDGMHLSADGLKAWFNCVRTHVCP